MYYKFIYLPKAYSPMQTDPIAYATMLYIKGFLIVPKICDCEIKIFKIYKDSHYKINQFSFCCQNYKCKKIFQITINSFFNKFHIRKYKLFQK
jgi:hypothetical protein